MLWRVRTTLPDRPGALAELARTCGSAGVNILGVQIFPAVDAVTDEIVVRTPVQYDAARLRALVEAGGGTEVTALACTEEALADQPTRYVQAARAVLAAPARFPEVVATLFDAESEPAPGGPAMDVMELTVGDVVVQIRRHAAFTATEHARGEALAELVGDVLARGGPARPAVPPMPRRSAVVPAVPSGSIDYTVEEGAVLALVGDQVVGRAVLEDDVVEPGVRPVDLSVDPAWHRRGIGKRLLTDVARLAAGSGEQEIVIRTAADNQAVLPMVLGAGLRGRIRMAGDVLTVRIPVRDLKPLVVGRGGVTPVE